MWYIVKNLIANEDIFSQERLALSVAGQSEIKKPIKHSNSNKGHNHQHRNNYHGAPQSSSSVQTPMNLAVPVPPIAPISHRSPHRVPQRYSNNVKNGAQT